MTRVDLIIPTLNGSALLARCLHSLAGSTYTDFNLTVFDDGSSEPIATVVHSRYPQARVMRSARNVGLARAFNLAIEAGQSEYVVLLNNDTIVEHPWLAQLVACADRHPRAGSVASKLRLMDDRMRLHSAGDTWSVRGMPGNRGVWLNDVGQYDDESEVFSACGGAALYRRSALDDLRSIDGHVFNERLFMYLEDVEIGWRLQARGWRCMFAPNAVVYHALSATGGGAFASYYVARNLMWLLAHTVPLPFVAPYRWRMAAFHAGRILRALRHVREPAARATLRGTFVGPMWWLTSHQSRTPITAGEQARVASLLVHTGQEPTLID